MSSDWPVRNSEQVFECPWFSVGYDELDLPNGDQDRFYWIDRPQDAVAIVAIEDEDVVMIEQYRPKLGRRFLECPGGHIERGENPADAAARELREETGLVASEFDVLTQYAPVANMRYERSVVVARDIERGQAEPDETEFLEWQFVSAEEALAVAQEAPTTG